MRVKKILALFLILLVFLTQIPRETAFAEDFFDLTPEVFIDDIKVLSGKKGVKLNPSRIKIHTGNHLNRINPERDIKEIRIIANGKYDETEKFHIGFWGGNIYIDLKDKPTSGDFMPVFQLRPHTLYTIYIPSGIIVNQDKKQNRAYEFNFVTESNDGKTDIIKATNLQDRIYKDINKIEITFIDDISFNQNINDFLQITATPQDSNIPLTGANKLEDFDIKIDKDKLILSTKDNKPIQNFTDFKFTIKDKALRLKNSKTPICNDEHIIEFTTYNMLDKTYPQNNQEGVEVEPTIRFVFKYPIELIQSKQNISISSDARKFSLSNDDITISNNQLKLNINDLEGSKIYPLRRNTLYRVHIPKGTIKFKEYNILNDDINLYFITRGEGDSPKIIRYSSDPQGTDDITSQTHSRLTKDGSIYILFDRQIQWDKQYQNTPKKDIVKLYKIPEAHEKAYDETGKIYDKVFEFNPNTIKEKDLKEERVDQIGDVKIEQNYIKITPKYSLIPLNKYRLKLDRNYIEDKNGYNIEKDIDFYFWTSPEGDKVPHWEGLESVKAREIIEDKKAPYKSYTLHGIPPYSDENPIIMTVDSEVIPKAGDIEVLKNIKLTEGFDTSKNIELAKIRLEYFFEDKVKKTRIYFYPNRELDAGKLYSFFVPGNVFQARSGNFLSMLMINFVIEGDSDIDPEVAKIVPSEIDIFKLYKGTESFTIFGHNFTEDIEKVVLMSTTDDSEIEIDKKDIKFVNITEIKVLLQDRDIIDKFIADGEYEVKLYFKNGREVDAGKIKTTRRGRPVVLEKYPEGGSEGNWHNEKELFPRTIDGKTRYFLRVTFEDIDGTLKLSDDIIQLLKNSSVFSQGQSQNSMIDTEFLDFIQEKTSKQYYINTYIFNKTYQKAHLYIPVKPLRANTTYTVMLNPGLVYFPGEEQNPSETLMWTFSTMPIPIISDVYIGSVPEYYDYDKPVILYGSRFSENARVFFNDYEARKVKLKHDVDGKPYLEVYLPKGSDRLEPGVYTIKVQNDSDHGFEIIGSFSVIEEGEYIPEEDYRVKRDYHKGQVIAYTKVSEDTLHLKRNYTDRNRLELDLDDLMGEDVLVRNIEFNPRRRDRIGRLETLSKWADITLYDVRESSNADGDVKIKLGRVEPTVAQMIKRKLGNLRLKSEIIQVAGENYDISSVRIVMPFKYSDGRNLDVLRFDFDDRTFHRESCYIDKIEKTVEILSRKPGIFVVVEDPIY